MGGTPFHAFDSIKPEQRHHMLVQSLRLAVPHQMVNVNGAALTPIVAAKALYDVVVMRVIAAHLDLEEARRLNMPPQIVQERDLQLGKLMLEMKAGSFGWGIKQEQTNDAVDSTRPGTIITSG